MLIVSNRAIYIMKGKKRNVFRCSEFHVTHARYNLQPTDDYTRL